MSFPVDSSSTGATSAIDVGAVGALMIRRSQMRTITTIRLDIAKSAARSSVGTCWPFSRSYRPVSSGLRRAPRFTVGHGNFRPLAYRPFDATAAGRVEFFPGRGDVLRKKMWGLRSLAIKANKRKPWRAHPLGRVLRRLRNSGVAQSCSSGSEPI